MLILSITFHARFLREPRLPSLMRCDGSHVRWCHSYGVWFDFFRRTNSAKLLTDDLAHRPIAKQCNLVAMLCGSQADHGPSHHVVPAIVLILPLRLNIIIVAPLFHRFKYVMCRLIISTSKVKYNNNNNNTIILLNKRNKRRLIKTQSQEMWKHNSRKKTKARLIN